MSLIAKYKYFIYYINSIKIVYGVIIVDNKIKNKREIIEEKIGEGLIRINAIKKEQVDDVLARQKNGDDRLFGEIAVELGYVDVQAVIDYLKSTNKLKS